LSRNLYNKKLSNVYCRLGPKFPLSLSYGAYDILLKTPAAFNKSFLGGRSLIFAKMGNQGTVLIEARNFAANSCNFSVVFFNSP